MASIATIRKTIIIVLLCVVVLCLAALLEEGFFTPFKRSVSLSYQKNEMEYVHVGTWGHSSDFLLEIYDPEIINQIIDYINSLKIVEIEQPNYLAELTFNGTWEDWGFITIYFENGTELDNNYRMPGDLIQFYGKYMVTSYEGRDWAGKCYYVKDFGYDNKTNSNNMYQFLRNLLDE